MTPYYSHAGIEIYHGDCREMLPLLNGGGMVADLILTDPPYGIADKWKGSCAGGWANARTQQHERNAWDDTPPDAETLQLCLSKAKYAILWGGNYFALPPSRCWFVWNKPERGFTLAEAELAWTNLDAVVRVCDCRRSDPDREHPTQKPLGLMKWCMARVKDAQSVLDPFMGSGTTLLAAKEHGLCAIGIEREEKYCEIAAKRLGQEVFDFSGKS